MRLGKKSEGDSQGGESRGGNTTQKESKAQKKQGFLLLDETCTSVDITSPADVRLLNEACEKLEGTTHRLHPHTDDKRNPAPIATVPEKSTFPS